MARQPEAPLATGAHVGPEVDRGMGDEAGRQTHAHGWHCTPRPRPAQATAHGNGILSRGGRAGPGRAPPCSSIRRATSKRSAPATGRVRQRVAALRVAASVAQGLRQAARRPVAGLAGRPAPSMPSRTESATPGPSSATTGSPTASASASTRPCVSVCEATAKRSAPLTAESASSRGMRPVSATRPARSGAAGPARERLLARVRRRSAAGELRSLFGRNIGEGIHEQVHALLWCQAAQAGHDHASCGQPAAARGSTRNERPGGPRRRRRSGSIAHQRRRRRSEAFADLGRQGRCPGPRCGAAAPEAAQVGVHQRRTPARGQRPKVVAVVAEARVVREHQRRARARRRDGPSGPR